ncbi:MAG TPA: DNA internalization-related competence protein ComEC/Rec2 [Sedimenticola sp.]|nr:DNA internalization-related competence protein ComEC/Rec2 [Sedimenticola sp.]
MIGAAVAFVAGVICFQQQAELPALAWAGLFPFLLAAIPLRRVRLPVFFGLGFLWALLHAHWLLSGSLAPALEGKDLDLEGVVVSLPEQRGRRLRFLFEVQGLRYEGVEYPGPGLVRLSWYRDAPALRVGERWRLQARLRRPHGFMNPGGFDYEGWLFRQGIRATGYVRRAPLNGRLAESGPWFSLQRLRQGIRDRIARAVPDRPAAGILTALVIGDRSGIGRDQREILARTGASHLIAISGLHVGMIAGLAFFLFRWLWSRFYSLTLHAPAPQAAACLALAAALLYAALAGFALPARRALIMLAVVMGAVLLRRCQRPSRTLALALFLVVAADPLAVLSAGFWLSFAAVGVILFGVSGHLSGDGPWRKWGRVQWLVAIGLAPVLAARGMQVSLLGPLVNLVAVPLFGLFIVPLALLGALSSIFSGSLGALPLGLAAWLLDGVVGLLRLAADQPFAAWDGKGAGAWIWLVAIPGVLLLLAPAGTPGRWLGLAFLLPMMLARPPVPAPGEAWFSLLDVGQGLSAVVRTHGHTLVYDAGPRFSADFDAGSAVVAPFLKQAGVSHIDRLVLSNGDSDHAGGGRALASVVPVRELISGEPGEIGWAAALPCHDGMQWDWDGVRFRFLHPAVGERRRGNNASCVLLVENDAGRVLLPGDIEEEVERLLVRKVPDLLAADLVQVPHHGSRTSSTGGFLEAVSPRYALVSAGHGNRYGFPQPEVVRRWRAAGALVLQTAERGAIRFRLDPRAGISGPESYRMKAGRYWNAAGRAPVTYDDRIRRDSPIEPK